MAKTQSDLKEGETRTVKGSGKNSYTISRLGEVFSCSCPSWKHQSATQEKRTCKHLKALRGEDVENKRLGVVAAPIDITKLKAVPHPGFAPIKPYKPLVSKTLRKLNKFYEAKNVSRKDINLMDALKNIPSDVPLETVKMVFSQSSNWQRQIHFHLATVEEVPNPRYDVMMKRYDDEVATFKERTAVWKAKLAKYDEYCKLQSRCSDLFEAKRLLTNAEKAAAGVVKMRENFDDLVKKYSIKLE